MILTINHETVYRYDEAVRYSTQYLRLTPPCEDGQKILEWRLDLPVPAQSYEDAFGNVLHVMILDMPHSEIRVRATGIVETEAGVRMSYGGVDPRVYLRATALTAMDEGLAVFADQFNDLPPSIDLLDAVMDALHQRLLYGASQDEGVLPAAEVWQAGGGSSRDHAHVFVACCRHLGLPARFVSGYMHTPGHGELPMREHAWAEVWLEDRWWSFDPVNRGHAGESHLKLAVGIDYLDACPVRGACHGSCGEVLEAQVMSNRMVAQRSNVSDSAESILQQQQQQQ